MEDLTEFTALNHSGSFGKNFVKYKKKINMLFTGEGSVRMVKNCDRGHSFSPYGPPSRQITHIYG